MKVAPTVRRIESARTVKLTEMVRVRGTGELGVSGEAGGRQR